MLSLLYSTVQRLTYDSFGFIATSGKEIGRDESICQLLGLTTVTGAYISSHQKSGTGDNSSIAITLCTTHHKYRALCILRNFNESIKESIYLQGWTLFSEQWPCLLFISTLSQPLSRIVLVTAQRSGMHRRNRCAWDGADTQLGLAPWPWHTYSVRTYRDERGSRHLMYSVEIMMIRNQLRFITGPIISQFIFFISWFEIHSREVGTDPNLGNSDSEWTWVLFLILFWFPSRCPPPGPYPKRLGWLLL